MKVYFDDMNKPMMTAQDTTFGAGQIGIGTFDDSGNFDDFVLRGKQVVHTFERRFYEENFMAYHAT